MVFVLSLVVLLLDVALWVRAGLVDDDRSRRAIVWAVGVLLLALVLLAADIAVLVSRGVISGS